MEACVPAKELSCTPRALGSHGRVLSKSVVRSGAWPLAGGRGSGVRRQEADEAVRKLLSYSRQCSLESGTGSVRLPEAVS